MQKQNNPVELLKEAICLLQKHSCSYALSGGFAASLYRQEPRLTQDVDFTLVAKNITEAQKIATTVQSSLNLSSGKLTEALLIKAPQMNKKQSPVMSLAGRTKDKLSGVDFLFETFPWAKIGVERALNVNFKFAIIPTLTAEDLLISKAYTMTFHQVRYKDLDDFEQIAINQEIKLDYIYLAQQFEQLKLCIPRDLEKKVPKQISRISRAIRKATS